MDRTPAISIASFAVAALAGAAGQFLYKAAADRATGAASLLVSGRAWGGVACYTAVMALFLYGFRRGGSPSVLYPVYASTFIWAAFIARWTTGTPIEPAHWAGMALLVAGMFMMGR